MKPFHEFMAWVYPCVAVLAVIAGEMHWTSIFIATVLIIIGRQHWLVYEGS